MLALPLPLSPSRPLPGRPDPCAGLLAVGPAHPRRVEAEAFVRRIYRERFGAELRTFAPRLVVLRDAAGDIVAAAGYRAAASGPLFLERYLDAPVEALLAQASGQRPPRARIAEVGHLAASRAGEGRRLILLLAPYLAAHGFQWVVSTLTEELRHLFVRLGIPPFALGVAHPDALGAEAADWGRYYDHRPVVLAGQIESVLALLARRRVAA